jgi:hypothetical protein
MFNSQAQVGGYAIRGRMKMRTKMKMKMNVKILSKREKDLIQINN